MHIRSYVGKGHPASVTEPPFESSANDPMRRRPPPKVQTLADPPEPPGLKSINFVGFGVVRDNDGQPRALQQAGVPRDDIASARYVVAYDNFDDACLEAEEQLIEALAHHTYDEDARHTVRRS